MHPIFFYPKHKIPGIVACYLLSGYIWTIGLPPIYVSLGPMGMAFSWRGCSLQTIPPSWEKIPPCWGPGVMWSSGRTGVAQLVARSTPDWCVVGSSPTCGTEHFGFPPSAPRLGNQRPWYVQPRLCDWAYKRSRATYRKEKGIVSRWSVSSFIKFHKFHSSSNHHHRTE